MAKIKQKPRPTDEDDEEDVPDMLGGAPPVDTGGLENLLNQLGELQGEAKVHVYRVRQGTRPPFAFLFATTAGQFAVEDVQARYGGGDYFVKAWQRGIAGSLINERFAIEGEPIIQRPMQQPAPIPSAPGMPQIYALPGQGNDTAAIVNTILAGFQQMTQALVQQPPRQGMREALELLTIAKAIVAPGGGQNSSEILGVLSQVMGIMRESQPLVGEGGKADGWSLMQTAIEKVLPAIIERLPVNMPAALAAPDPSPRLPPGNNPFGAVPASLPGSLAEAATAAAAGNSPAPINAAPGAKSVHPMITTVIGAYVPMFVQAASIGAEPGTYAENIVDMIDANPATEPIVRAFLARADWIDTLASQAPAVGVHRDWFSLLGREVLATLDAPEDDETASPEAEHFGG